MADRWGRLAGGRGVLLCTITLALALAGCGSETDPSPEREIEAMLERVYMSGDPDMCGEAYTQNALDQLRDVTGASSPLESCERQTGGEPWNVAKSVVLTDLKLDGETASVTLVPAGGEYDGSSLSLRLADRAGWRIDHIGRLEIFNRKRFLKGWLRDDRRNGGMSAAEATCVEGWIRAHVSTDRLERIFVDAQASSYMAPAMTHCYGDGSDERALATMFRRSLVRRYELSYGQADCVVAALRPWLARYSVERFYRADRDPAFTAALNAAGRVCVGPTGPQGLAHDQS